MGLSKVGDLGHFIRDQRRNARLSLRKLSNMAGISNPYLSQIERGMRRPSAEILQAIAKALRISAETLYVKAGILEERGDATDPVTAILRDLTMTDKQKQVLIEIYQSFRHENELEGRNRVTQVAAGPAGKKAVALQKQESKPAVAKAKRASKAGTASKSGTTGKTQRRPAQRARTAP
jgi:transcriptional regulator with XRE-family HTH domain